MKQSAIVIGAGIGGLATAIRLAVLGYETKVFEKNDYPGGKLSNFQQDGYDFDAGPSLFTAPENIEALFQLANEPMDNYFSYTRLPETFRYFWENGKQLVASSNPEEFALQMEQILGENKATVRHYLSKGEQLYKHVAGLFLHKSLHKWQSFSLTEVWRALKAIQPNYLFGTLHRHHQLRFKSKEAIQLFNRYATYNGSDPYQAPAMLSLIPHLEMNQGTFYPKGGMISITNALYRLAIKKGVQFHFNEPVISITTANNRVNGILTSEQQYPADVVVSNVDIYFTLQKLLNQPLAAENILKQERSSSALIFYWGIDKEFTQLGLHNILFSNNYQEEFHHIFKQGTISNDVTVYINITSKMETGHAPEGKENWFVMVNVPANSGQDWKLLQQQARQSVVEKINKVLQINIASFIATESILDPVLIEQKTDSYMGSLYGTSSNSKWAAFLRHPNFSKKLKGLYFTGGSVHPGGGIPLCLHSAEITADLIVKDHKNR